MTKILKKCSCGSGELIMHESEGYALIICQVCGREVVHKGDRADAERIWDENTGSD